MSPARDSSSTSNSNFIFLPLPNQLFSEIEIPNEPPLVPTPAPALISPVGFSSILISITFKLFSVPFDTFYFFDEFESVFTAQQTFALQA